MLTRPFSNYQKISEFATIENEAGPNGVDSDRVPYKGKLIGMEDVSTDRDEKECLDLIYKLKTVVRARGEHKQKVQIQLTLEGVKIIDELTKVELACHEIPRISFVIMDPRDLRAFGYVYNTSDERHQFWAIKTERPAHSAVLTLKDLFDETYRNNTSSENGDAEENQATSTLPFIDEVIAPIQTSLSEFSPFFTTESSIQSPKSAPFTTQVPATAVFDNAWGGNLSTTTSLPSQTFQQQSTFDDDAWGFNKPAVPVKQSAPRVVDSPTNIFILPPPPTPLSRRLTTTQPPASTTGTGDLFSVFTTTSSTSSVNNNGFTQSTQQIPSVSQQQPNYLNSTPISSITSPPPTVSAFNDFDLATGSQQQPNFLNSTSASSIISPPPTTTSAFDDFDSFAGSQQQPNFLNVTPASSVTSLPTTTTTSAFGDFDSFTGSQQQPNYLNSTSASSIISSPTTSPFGDSNLLTNSQQQLSFLGSTPVLSVTSPPPPPTTTTPSAFDDFDFLAGSQQQQPNFLNVTPASSIISPPPATTNAFGDFDFLAGSQQQQPNYLNSTSASSVTSTTTTSAFDDFDSFAGSQQQQNFLNSTPASSVTSPPSTTTTKTSPFGGFDFLDDFSSEPTVTKPVNELFFSS